MEKVTIEEIRLLLKYMSKGYKVPEILHDEVFNAAVREIEDKKRVILIKRDPDVEAGRLQARLVKVVDGNTMEMHPATISPFGADFDGDSYWGRLRCSVFHTTNINGQINITKLTCQAEDILSKTDGFIFREEKVKSNGIIVKKYDMKPDYRIEILAIDPATGKSEMKNISEYSVHENIKMFKIEDSKDRFESFWASSDHSLIVYDGEDQMIKKISPIDLLANPTNKFLIQKGDIKNEQGSIDS